MRRLPRLILRAATTLSLLLALATIALWVRSYLVMDRIWIEVHPDTRPNDHYGLACLQSGKGGAGFYYNRIDFSNFPDPARNARAVYSTSIYKTSDPQYPNEWSGARTGLFHFVSTGQEPGTLPCFVGGIECTIPYWFLALITFPGSVLCTRNVLRRLRRRRPAPTTPLCPTCGYDLRATPNRCPECGHIPFSDGTDQ